MPSDSRRPRSLRGGRRVRGPEGSPATRPRAARRRAGRRRHPEARTAGREETRNAASGAAPPFSAIARIDDRITMAVRAPSRTCASTLTARVHSGPPSLGHPSWGRTSSPAARATGRSLFALRSVQTWAAPMMRPMCAGSKKSTGETVPDVRLTNSSIAAWFPYTAPSSCWNGSGGVSSVANCVVKS